MNCSSGRCNNIPDECSIPRGSYWIGGPYLSEMDGEYFFPEGCSGICQGCEVAPPPPCEGCAWDMPCIPHEDVCHSWSTGMSYCPELDQCIGSWETNCPLEEGATIEGPIQIQCSDGRCSDIPDDCHIPRSSYAIGGPYIGQMDGYYFFPEGCSAFCQGCEVVVSSPPPPPPVGETTIRDVSRLLCMEVKVNADGLPKKGNNVKMSACNGSENQKWIRESRLRQGSIPTFALTTKLDTDLCLEVEFKKIGDNQRQVHVAECIPSEAEDPNSDPFKQEFDVGFFDESGGKPGGKLWNHIGACVTWDLSNAYAEIDVGGNYPNMGRCADSDIPTFQFV